MDTHAPVALADADRPLSTSEVCAEGDHGVCLGTVYVWPPPEGGPYVVRCECPVCNHEVSRLAD
jgi:hypothetical protein